VTDEGVPIEVQRKWVIGVLLTLVIFCVGLPSFGNILMNRGIHDARGRAVSFYEARKRGDWIVPDTRFGETMKKEVAAHEAIHGLPMRFTIRRAYAQVLGRPAICEMEVVRGGHRFLETLTFNGNNCFWFHTSELKVGLSDEN
jgi:hypothetical protein